ncbi:hypothetical protein [Aquimarina sp. AU474]|uniref:hypothetical protein n=1 Tax=Aquimarina sp. AU474 TaxID=2108529 RepID=UPI000D6A0485|nr:hypothetical protein [Aquimarina sp. AU474]
MITKQEVENAQKAWGQGVVRIGTLQSDKEQCKTFTQNFVDEQYDFDTKEVLFKPTKAGVQQFRINKEGAISYFIGSNSKYDEDQGFALQPWIHVRFENAAIILEENRALAMGNYFFTDTNNVETKVEYTFGYHKKPNGKLKIDVHHSSLPFNVGESV